MVSVGAADILCRLHMQYVGGLRSPLLGLTECRKKSAEAAAPTDKKKICPRGVAQSIGEIIGSYGGCP